MVWATNVLKKGWGEMPFLIKVDFTLLLLHYTYKYSVMVSVLQGGRTTIDKCLPPQSYIGCKKQLVSIAFPNISTGVYHFPKDKAAAIAITAGKAFLQNDSVVKEAVFVCFNEENYFLYKNCLTFND